MVMLNENFYGKWVLEDADVDNFEKYLTAIGMPWIKRKVAKNMNIDVEFTNDKAPLYRVKIMSKISNIDATFKLDGTFEPEKTVDGRNCMSKHIIAEDGLSIDQEQTWEDGKKVSMQKFQLEGEKMILYMECNGCKTRRVHRKNK